MKNLKKFLVVGLALVMALGMMVMFAGCGESEEATEEDVAIEETTDVDPVAVCNEAIEAIQVQERTDETDAQCEAAKAAYDALTDEQKEQLDDPDYFGLDTGDASKDDPLNQDDIGENELLVCSFGTSFNDSRAEDILTGPSEERSPRRSSSTTYRHVTERRSTICSRLWTERRLTASRTWSSSRHT